MCVLVLNNISIQPEGTPLDREVCTCGFSVGKFVCLPRKFNVRSESVMCNILVHSKAWYLGVLVMYLSCRLGVLVQN